MAKLKNETVKGNRSLSEQIIIDRLRLYFKKLIVLPSDKTAIGKELDIFLPNLKVGIEIQGPTHTVPIFGEATLLRTQASDAKKVLLCEAAGIKLIHVYLPEKSSEYVAFLKDEVPNKIVPAIKAWLEIQPQTAESLD